MLSVRVENSGKLSIVRCEGRMVFGEPLERVRDAVLCHADKIVKVDLGGVVIVDAAGLGLIASLCRLAYAAGIDFSLVNPTTRVQEVLELVRLDCAIDLGTSLERLPHERTDEHSDARSAAA